MNIKIIYPIGYCNGVNNAINNTINLAKNNQNKIIYTYGDLIHNKHTIDHLKKNNIYSINPTEDIINIINKEDIFVFSAHGTDENLKKEIIKKEINLHEAKCNFIKDIEEYAKMNNVIYIGDIHHIEGYLFYKNNQTIPFFDIKKGFINEKNIKKEKYYLINQSTFNDELLDNIYEKIKRLGINFIVHNTTCIPLKTKYNNFKIELINSDYDLVLILGDKSSNNANILLNIYYKYTKIQNHSFISSFNDLEEIDLNNIKNILLVSATSTPNNFINKVLDYLKTK